MGLSNILKYFTLLVFPLFGLIFSFISKDKKIKYFLLITIASSFKILSSDLENYSNIYLQSTNYYDSLLYFVFLIFNKIGISFTLFLKIYMFLCCSIIYSTIFNLLKKIKAQKFSLIVFINILLFPQIFDLSSHILKQFLSSVIVLYIFSYAKLNTKSLILSLIAILIHSVGFMSILYIIVSLNQKYYAKYFLIVTSFIFLILMNYNNIIGSQFYDFIFVGNFIKVDNSSFGSNGLLFLQSTSILLFISFILSKRLKNITNSLCLAIFCCLIVQLLPDRLYIIKYRFILFSYLPLLLLIYLELIHYIKKFKINPNLFFPFLTICNIYLFVFNFGDVFDYKFELSKLIFTL